MKIADFIFIVLIGITLIHLYACGKQKNKLRVCTKCLILLSLLIWYCMAESRPSTALIIAMAASCFGDFFLIWDDMVRFVLGGACFITAQFIYFFTYSKNIVLTGWTIPALILISVGYLAAVIMDFVHLDGKLERKLLIPTCLYLGVNGAMNCAAFGQLISVPGIGSLMVFLGALSFFVSDVVLFDFNFNKESKHKTHFLIMLTYAFAQIMIITGMTLI